MMDDRDIGWEYGYEDAISHNEFNDDPPDDIEDIIKYKDGYDDGYNTGKREVEGDV